MDALSMKSMEGSGETVSLLWVDVKLIMGNNPCNVLKKCQPMHTFLVPPCMC